MFPYEDSKTVSVCPYPEKINHPGFANISPTLVIDASMEGLHEYYSMETQKYDFFNVRNWILTSAEELKSP